MFLLCLAVSYQADTSAVQSSVLLETVLQRLKAGICCRCIGSNVHSAERKF